MFGGVFVVCVDLRSAFVFGAEMCGFFGCWYLCLFSFLFLVGV